MLVDQPIGDCHKPLRNLKLGVHFSGDRISKRIHPEVWRGVQRRIGVGLAAGALAALAGPPPAEATMLLKLEEIGGNVVVRGSGSVNLDGLTLRFSSDTYTNALTSIQVYAGPNAFDDGSVDVYEGLKGSSTSISSDPELSENPTSYSGSNLFGLVTNDGSDKPLLVLPRGYISGTELGESTSTYEGTFSGLGLSVGTSTYSWSSGGTTQNVLVQVGSTPVPAPFCLAGAGAAFSCIRRLKRNSFLLHQHGRKGSA